MESVWPLESVKLVELALSALITGQLWSFLCNRSELQRHHQPLLDLKQR